MLRRDVFCGLHVLSLAASHFLILARRYTREEVLLLRAEAGRHNLRRPSRVHGKWVAICPRLVDARNLPAHGQCGQAPTLFRRTCRRVLPGMPTVARLPARGSRAAAGSTLSACTLRRRRRLGQDNRLSTTPDRPQRPTSLEGVLWICTGGELMYPGVRVPEA